MASTSHVGLLQTHQISSNICSITTGQLFLPILMTHYKKSLNTNRKKYKQNQNCQKSFHFYFIFDICSNNPMAARLTELLNGSAVALALGVASRTGLLRALGQVTAPGGTVWMAQQTNYNIIYYIYTTAKGHIINSAWSKKIKTNIWNNGCFDVMLFVDLMFYISVFLMFGDAITWQDRVYLSRSRGVFQDWGLPPKNRWWLCSCWLWSTTTQRKTSWLQDEMHWLLIYIDLLHMSTWSSVE